MTIQEAKSENRILGGGDFFLIAAVIAWGVNFPIAKFTLSYMEPVVFSATRYLAASLLLFIILLVRREAISIKKREVGLLVIIGFFGITLFQGGWAYGLNFTSASKASILITTSPIFGALLSAIMGNRPSLMSWCGIIIAFLGVVIIINNSLTEIVIDHGSMLGDLLIVGASLMWAIYTFISAPIVSRRGPLLVTAWAMLFGAVILSLAGHQGLIDQDWSGITSTGWLAWAVTSVFGAALAFVWYCAGIVRLGITRGMVYSFFIPVVAILTSVLFFGETLSLVQICGAVVILFGVILTRAG
ncbi:DMT family transporter [Sneathiella marina]|uniref:DMT family transporter n=1 Tax=Sneathiella marina TaxID=2950108 RepID=A0ABY4W3V2_9PROT|nr:EamA family transporter [Sneathiella marina]USG61866.1 DMT family transporter [Sneathiella marina]